MYYTRNRDLNYYDTYRGRANCGSYALRLNEWYRLNERFIDKTDMFIEDWAYDEGSQGIPNSELTRVFGEVLLECLLEDFGDELEICDGALPTSDNVELIVFNVFCRYSDEWDPCVDSDFHFKVFRNGKWMEKCGWGKVKECEEHFWGIYTGEPVYLYHKLS